MYSGGIVECGGLVVEYDVIIQWYFYDVVVVCGGEQDYQVFVEVLVSVSVVGIIVVIVYRDVVQFVYKVIF